ncbi:hypothetical protein HYE40_02415 [Mycoplasmopsis bovis]|nr:hypothetical protein [Mycoplasmopsis bovis]QQH20909.1 hypothetical protein HYE40_02415 [Mycoplasmopsis bovis]
MKVASLYFIMLTDLSFVQEVKGNLQMVVFNDSYLTTSSFKTSSAIFQTMYILTSWLARPSLSWCSLLKMKMEKSEFHFKINFQEPISREQHVLRIRLVGNSENQDTKASINIRNQKESVSKIGRIH